MSIAELVELRAQTGMLTSVTSARPGPGDFVAADPQDLADQAGVDVDVYSLARMMASEGYGGKDELGKTVAAVVEGQCIVNKAKLHGRTVTAHLTRAIWSSGAAAPGQGHYGPQGSRFAGYRDASTNQDPTAWHLAVAQAVIDGGLPDFATGAIDFLDPSTFKAGTQGGEKLSPIADVLTRWSTEDKLAWIGDVPGLDPWYLLVLRKESDADVRAAALSAALEVGAGGPRGAAPGDPDDVPSSSGLGGLVALLVVVAGVAAAVSVLA